MTDLADVRRHFPALHREAPVYLDGAGGTQVPHQVIAAMTEFYRAGVSNVGGPFESSSRSGDVVLSARQAVADLLGGDPGGVILGPNATTLTFRLAQALGRTWRAGDEIVVSQLDHDANVRPWLQAADRARVTVRWAIIDPRTGELPPAQFADLLNERTRLVAITAASNLIGTRPDVETITRAAHDVGALTFVDAVAAAPHVPLDVVALGADFCSTSAYKWFGPHVGAVIADPALLEGLRPDKLKPSSDEVPNRFETGTHAFPQLAGVVAAVDVIAGFGDPDPDRRTRLIAAMSRVHDQESRLLQALLGGLSARPGIEVIGRPARRTAVVSFRAAEHSPLEVSRFMAGRRINVGHGHAYAWELVRALGLGEQGVVRASLAPYSTLEDVARLLEGLDALGYPESPCEERRSTRVGPRGKGDVRLG